MYALPEYHVRDDPYQIEMDDGGVIRTKSLWGAVQRYSFPSEKSAEEINLF